MWDFNDETKPIVGMYGMKNSDDERISQLGWIQLDTVCQDAYDASWTPSDPTPAPEPTPTPEPEPTPTPTPTPSGDNDDIISYIWNGFASQLDWDLSAKFRVSPGDAYVGYDGTGIAYEVWEGNVNDEGIALKSKNVKN